MTLTQHRPFSESGADPVAAAADLLMRWSGTTVWPLGRDEQMLLLKRARFAVHPDRNHGNRDTWDQIEEAARILGIHH